MNVKEMNTEELLDTCLEALIELNARYPRERMFAKVLDRRDLASVVQNLTGWRGQYG